jgi:hypothetical protein
MLWPQQSRRYPDIIKTTGNYSDKLQADGIREKLEIALNLEKLKVFMSILFFCNIHARNFIVFD